MNLPAGIIVVLGLSLTLAWKMGILEKIAEIEREIARTQKNKGNVLKGRS